jgi:tRNA pseudouridine55 synthase
MAGLLLVDKPTGPTSHDVVGRGRRVLGTRRVGHAGTLDPLASGLLVLGVERGTRLLGHLALRDKTYLATVRLGVATSTEDSQGEVTAVSDTSAVDEAAVRSAIEALTGDLLQVPSSVSAIKVDGRRAYELVRAGVPVELAARPVTVRVFDLLALHRDRAVLDLDVRVDCTTGTYIRALARDLGAMLGVGAHLTALRRTRIGPFDVCDAVDLWSMDADQREVAQRAVIPAAAAAAVAFPIRRATAREAVDLSYGRSLEVAGIEGTYAVVDESGNELLALASELDGRAKPVLVWHSAG